MWCGPKRLKCRVRDPKKADRQMKKSVLLWKTSEFMAMERKEYRLSRKNRNFHHRTRMFFRTLHPPHRPAPVPRSAPLRPVRIHQIRAAADRSRPHPLPREPVAWNTTGTVGGRRRQDSNLNE